MAASCTSQSDFDSRRAKWVPYNKGGHFRKWYGNLDYVLNWQNEGEAIKALAPGEKRSFSILPEQYRFKPTITWTDITSSCTHFRFRPAGSLYDIKGMSCFPHEKHRLYVLGFCNSAVATMMLKMLSPTMNTQVGDVGKLPVLQASQEEADRIDILVANSIDCAMEDWDVFEISWDFKCHPLV